MELMTLDVNFLPTGKTKLKYFDLTWYRKYYETGQFLVQIRASDYSPDMEYIYTNERPELGIIQCVEYSDNGGMVTLSGFFYERKLADKIIYPTYVKYGTRAAYVAGAVGTYKADIPRLVVAEYSDTGEKIQKQETGTTLEEAAHSILKVDEKAYRCSYDIENDVVSFEIYQGLDRTQEQTENNYVVFSKGFRNLKNVSAKDDKSNYKNYFVVGGSGEGADRIYVIVDLSGGGYKQQLFLDCDYEVYDPDIQTLDEYKDIIRQIALEKAQDYVDIHNIEFDASMNGGAKYLEDYDLGDKCDIVIDEIQRSYQARIIEILETWNSGKHTVTLTFGDKIPTQYEKVRMA